MATTKIMLSGGDLGGTEVDWSLDDSGNPVAERMFPQPDGTILVYRHSSARDPKTSKRQAAKALDHMAHLVEVKRPDEEE